VQQEFGFMRVLSDVPLGEAYRCVYVLQLFLGAVCHDLKNLLATKLGKGLSPVPAPDEHLGGITYEALPTLIRTLSVMNEDKSILEDFATALEELKECGGDRLIGSVNTLKATRVYRRFKDGISTSGVRAG
jgi:hypothetical protein